VHPVPGEKALKPLPKSFPADYGIGTQNFVLAGRHIKKA